MTSAGCHIRQCDHGFYLSIKSTANIAIIFDLKQFSTKNFSFLTFLSQRRLPYTKNLPMAKNAARNSELMIMTMQQGHNNAARLLGMHEHTCLFFAKHLSSITILLI